MTSEVEFRSCDFPQKVQRWDCSCAIPVTDSDVGTTGYDKDLWFDRRVNRHQSAQIPRQTRRRRLIISNTLLACAISASKKTPPNPKMEKSVNLTCTQNPLTKVLVCYQIFLTLTTGKLIMFLDLQKFANLSVQVQGLAVQKFAAFPGLVKSSPGLGKIDV